MKYIDINQKFTAKVAEYIAKGYTINTATMSGSQGEVAHVDLTDGKQVVRVLLDSFTEYDSFNSLSGLEIVVGTPADKVVPYDTVRYNCFLSLICCSMAALRSINCGSSI